MTTKKKTHVIKRGAGVATRDDLEGGGLPITGQAFGNGERGETEGALAGDVEQLRRQGDVEVGRDVAAQSQVHEQVRPRVVQLQLQRAPRHRPVRPVVCGGGGGAGAFFWGVSESLIRRPSKQGGNASSAR